MAPENYITGASEVPAFRYLSFLVKYPMSRHQSAHPNDFSWGMTSSYMEPVGLSPQRMLDGAPRDARPKDKDETVKAAIANRIMELVLKSCGLKSPSSLPPNTLTSLSLNTRVRQPYEDFSNMLRSMTSLRELTLVDSLPWSIPSAIPDLMGGSFAKLPRGEPLARAYAWSLPSDAAGPSDAGEEPLGWGRDWSFFDTTDPVGSPSPQEEVLSFLDEPDYWSSHPIRVYPLVLPSTLRELTVHDRGFRCTQFLATIDCQLAKLEIVCTTDGFDPIPLFGDSTRLLGPPHLPEGAIRELLVRSESDKLVVQCSRSVLAYSDRPMADPTIQPALSIALDFSADDGLPSLAIYENIVTAGVKALPLDSVRRMLVDFHVDFRGAWFAGLFACLGSLESITLRRHAIDGFLQTHLWMAYNDPMVAMVPFRCLKTVFAEWDTRWPQARADADRILRYLNAGGVYLLFCNIGGHAEGFVRGPERVPEGLVLIQAASENGCLCCGVGQSGR